MKVYEIMSRVVVGRGETIHCIRLNPDGGKVEESRISEEEGHRNVGTGGCRGCGGNQDALRDRRRG